MNESNPSDEILAELLTLTREVGTNGIIRYRNSEGQLHRVHGPAVIYPDGTECWCQHGNRHRVDGPAVIYPDGTEYWYQHGDRHRTDGPAVIYKDGAEYWFQDGLRHSTYGPAVIYADGLSFWYLHGDRMSESEWEWKRAVDIMNACGQSPDE